MNTLHLSIGEPFTSPAWGSNFVVFSNDTGDTIPEDQVKEYIAKTCRYAKHYHVYTVTERFNLVGYQSMCLVSPEGKVIGAQKSCFLNLSWKNSKRASNIEILNTEFGGVALCIDVDIYHPEFPRLANSMGAQFLICSQFIQMGDYNTAMITNGVWGAAQSSLMYVIGVSNQYNCVCAPRRLTENDDGFIVTPRLKMPVTAKLSPEDLQKLPYREILPRRFYSVHHDDLLK